MQMHAHKFVRRGEYKRMLLNLPWMGSAEAYNKSKLLSSDILLDCVHFVWSYQENAVASKKHVGDILFI